MASYAIYLLILLATFVLYRKKAIEKDVSSAFVGIMMLAISSEQLIASGYITDGGSKQLIADYKEYTLNSYWITLLIGLSLCIVSFFSLYKNRIKK